MTVRRLPLIALLALGLALIAGAVTAAPAKADLYRYWSAWQLQSGSWLFLESAPASVIPGEGAVVGWRYAVGGVDGATMRPPRATPSFDDICGSTPAAEGQKRVGVVIDPGTQADAPEGQTPPAPTLRCAQGDNSASVEQLLQDVAPTRVEGGLVCAIEEYPSAGCGDTVAGATEAPVDTDEDLAVTFVSADDQDAAGSGFGSQALFLLLGLAVVIAVAVVAISKSRSRRPEDQ